MLVDFISYIHIFIGSHPNLQKIYHDMTLEKNTKFFGPFFEKKRKPSKHSPDNRNQCSSVSIVHTLGICPMSISQQELYTQILKMYKLCL